MQPHHTTTPYLVGPHEPDALSALATADDQLAIVLDTESAAILRLKNRIAAHEAQIEKIQQPGIHQTAEMKRAMGRLTFRLYQLNAALAEVESMRLVGFRAIVSVARGSLNTARQYARVESGLAREFRRRVDGDVGVRALDILTSGVS